MSTGQLKLAIVGGMGLMTSPMAKHLGFDGPAKALRVHDRGNNGERKDQVRIAWKAHGARLVSTLPQLIGEGEIDGVWVCCGKNGDDLPIISELASLLSVFEGKFICHTSTVSADFVNAAWEYCSSKGVQYVNYPLTGGPKGAEAGTMLVLASGDSSLYETLSPTLQCIGNPKFFGERISAGAEVKFIGHLMVFQGLMGISSAVALHAKCFEDGVLGENQVPFFDYLNGGAGGTSQWNVVLRQALESGIWSQGFMLPHATIDAVYLAKLCEKKGLSDFVCRAVIDVVLAFSYILNNHGFDLATQAVVRELLGSANSPLDTFVTRHRCPAASIHECLERAVFSLPDELQRSLALNIEVSDFSSCN